MFQCVINARSFRHTWVPVLQRCFSAVALSDHKQIRTVECQNGVKVGSFCEVFKVTPLVSTGSFLISEPGSPIATLELSATHF